jgi:hypothetical protein
MRRPKTSFLIWALVIGVAVLYVVSTYVSFMGYRDSLTENGSWTVEFKAQFQLGGSAPIQIVTPSIEVVYERDAGYVSYIDWLADRFSGSESGERDNGSAIYTVHVKVFTVSNMKMTHTLLDRTYFVHPDDLKSGTLFALNETFGPFIAYNSTLPLRAEYSIEVSGFSGQIGSSMGENYVTQWKK